MAVETVTDFLETGTIKNSVNFPDTSLPDRPSDTIRITVVNRNVPGMLAKITGCLANYDLNILQQINHSRGDIAYNVLDVDPHTADGKAISLRKLQEEITMLE